MTTDRSDLPADQQASIPKAVTATAEIAPRDARSVLGVDIDQPDQFLANLLTDPAQQNINQDVKKPPQKKNKPIPRNPEAWVRALFDETSPERIQEFLDSPPNSIDTLRQILYWLENIGFEQKVWSGLDRIVPGWVSPAHVEYALEGNNTSFLAYLGDSNNKIMEETAGLSFDPQGGGRWAICTGPYEGKTLSWEPEPEWDSEYAALIERVWIPATNKDGLIQITSWAEHFADFLYRSSDDAVLWLYKNVEELQAYTQGDDKPWKTAAQKSSAVLRKETTTQVGGHYAKEAAQAILRNTHLAESQPERFLEISRKWLDVPMMADRGIFERLAQNGRTIEVPPGLAGRGEPIAVDMLLKDARTRSGYINILRQTACAPLDEDIARGVKSKLGCTAADLPERITNQDTSGLVEAAMLIGQGTILNRLLSSSYGVKAIQKVLEGANGFHSLIQMGNGLGWGRLAGAVAEQPEAWRSWRDRHQNTITHWIAYGQTEMEDKPVWHVIQKLLKHFPEHFLETNAKNKEPADFLPREQADRVAAKLIRKVGSLPRAAKKERPIRPGRRI